MIRPPVKSPVLVMIKGGGTTMIRKLPEVVLTAGCCESVTFTVKVKVPAVVGVPLIKPLAFKISPAGSVEPAGKLQTTGVRPPRKVS